MSNNLFRPAALNAKQDTWLGQIIIVRPLSFSLMTLLALAFLGVLLTFFVLTSFTKIVSVSGQLMPSAGLIKIPAQQSGVVIYRWIVEGAQVNKGDRLYELSSERFTNDGNLELALAENMRRRVLSYQSQIEASELSSTEEIEAVKEKIASLEGNLKQVDLQIVGQEQRVRIAEEASLRYRNLVKEKFVSLEMANQKAIDVLDQKSRLQILIRERLTINQEGSELRRSVIPLRARNEAQIKQLQREIDQEKRDLLEINSKKNIVVISPADGRATGALAHVGQTIGSNATLVSIIPKNSPLQAFLYAESKHIGLLKNGDKVKMRYHAFPYEKFGLANGTINAISRSTLSRSDLQFMNYAPENDAPVYQIIVNIESQFISAYGENIPLQPGMLLTADIKQETRKIWEWVLNPLMGLAKNFKGGK